MSGLSTDHFAPFLNELYGDEGGGREPVRPFPWQQRLLDHVVDTGRWPDLLDLPTGAGKSTAVDIAVLAMALRDDQPRRVVFVVDRRVVVSQAAERAERLVEKLAGARDGTVCDAVAQRLRRLVGRPPGAQEMPPLQRAELRGGIVRDESWALRPDVPAVIASTVDQVGSRLLFRGYGVSTSLRPVHAGLLANDCLFLLDEVHLSRPFASTLAAIARRYRGMADRVLPDRWQVVRLSATPGDEHDDEPELPAASPTFRLLPEDTDPHSSPVLSRRVRARKPSELRLVRASGKEPERHRAELAAAACTAVKGLIERPHVRSLAVVVNRVDTAQRVHRALVADDPETFYVVLLTGRMRPFDRDDLLQGVRANVVTGRDRSVEHRRLVVVATQSIEAGADFDFDALVTECASLDALRQRFGRVDRDGALSQAGTPAPSIILATAAAVKGGDDPVYGRALAATWGWLSERAESVGGVDFGIDALELPAGAELADLLAPARRAPYLFPMHLDRWAQTSPQPTSDPDVALWLHGLEEVTQDVQVVWRADLSVELLRKGVEDGDEGLVPAVRLVSACLPGSGEAMPVPIDAARRWLAEVRAGRSRAVGQPEVTDVEGAGRAETGRAATEPGAEDREPLALRWRGDDSVVIADPGELVPGATIVVPSAYGGVRAGCWDPASTDPVEDLGVRAAWEQRLRPVLRLAPQLVPGPPYPGVLDEEDRSASEVVWDWLGQVRGIMDGPLARAVDGLVAGRRRQLLVQSLPAAVRAAEGAETVSEIFVVSSRRPLSRSQVTKPLAVDADSEPETSSFTAMSVPLLSHLDHVRSWAGALGRACQLPAGLVGDLTLAGWLHDVGKCDPRFQMQLFWPEMGRAATEPPLAKSALPASDVGGRRTAAAASGYPPGSRHELLSVALVQDVPALAAQAHDWDLVLHLVASHHGRARPFVPSVIDPAPVEARAVVDGIELQSSSDHGLGRLDSGVPERFWRLVRRYGWFGLAWLEAILRLADHRASAAEQQDGDGEGR